MRLKSHTAKADTRYRKDSGLSFHIHCRGLTKTKSRAEAHREFAYWKAALSDMCTELRSQGYHDDASQLRRDMAFREQQNALLVVIHPDSWHIFTYALRALSTSAYTRLMLQRHSDRNWTGWW